MFKFTNKLEISQIFRSDKHFGNPEGLTKLFIAEKIRNIWFIINTKNISKDKKKHKQIGVVKMVFPQMASQMIS